MNILIIEDEIQLADAVARLFEKHNYNVQIALDGEAGFNYAKSGLYDLIILDIMLPKINGFEVLQLVRSESINTPVLCLTAKSTLNDEIIGFNLGADDYITKPFSFDKLFARAKALMRRGNVINADILTIGNLTLNLDSCQLASENKSILLSAKEFHLFSLLAKKCGYNVSKEQIMDRVWGLDTAVEYNTVEVYISFLRKKLLALNANLQIKVTRNIGYRLEVIEND